MSICVILSVFALGLLLFILFSSRELITGKEGFVEYVVYGPGPWSQRHWRMRPWARHAKWFY